MKYNAEKFRPKDPGEILEGIILSQEEFKKTQTVTFFFNTGERVDNYYDAGSSSPERI